MKCFKRVELEIDLERWGLRNRHGVGIILSAIVVFGGIILVGKSSRAVEGAEGTGGARGGVP